MINAIVYTKTVWKGEKKKAFHEPSSNQELYNYF